MPHVESFLFLSFLLSNSFFSVAHCHDLKFYTIAPFSTIIWQSLTRNLENSGNQVGFQVSSQVNDYRSYLGKLIFHFPQQSTHFILGNLKKMQSSLYDYNHKHTKMYPSINIQQIQKSRISPTQQSYK